MDRDTLIRSLSLGPDLLDGFLALCDERDIDLSRGKGLWTIRDHTVHLALVQPMLFGRMEQFRDERHPTMKPYLPEDEEDGRRDGMGIEDASRKFRHWRERQIELLDSLDEAIWSRVGTHPEYRKYSLDILAAHTYFHDGFHLYRMEEMAFVKESSFTTLP
jgi:hypothetical protein